MASSSRPPPSPPPFPPDTPVPDEALFTEALDRLPMFPLPGVVLFPHALLPLHVFEERYKKMARDLLASNRHLAVALLADPADLDPAEPPAVHPVMGVGDVVMAHELPDGRFNLVVRGRARVRIVEELPTKEPYRVIRAQVVADAPVTNAGELDDSYQSLRALVERLADNIPDGGELLRQVVASQSTPQELCDVLAAALILEPHKRQGLLETPDLLRRLETVSSEVVTMTGRISTGGRAN